MAYGQIVVLTGHCLLGWPLHSTNNTPDAFRTFECVAVELKGSVQPYVAVIGFRVTLKLEYILLRVQYVVCAKVVLLKSVCLFPPLYSWCFRCDIDILMQYVRGH